MNRRKIGKWLFIGVILLFSAFFSFNFYIFNELLRKEKVNDLFVEEDIGQYIIKNVDRLSPILLKPHPDYNESFKKLQSMFKGNAQEVWTKSPAALWKLANTWPEGNRIYPLYEPLVGEIIKVIQLVDILKVDISPKGTQLKLEMLLAGNQTVVFKPKWYARDTIITGSVYSGKDRFNSEILAFYLGAILQFNWTPIAVGRKFNVKDIYRLSGARLKKTFVNNATSYCFYGVCHYCDRDNLVCGHQEHNYELEGVLLLVIPGKFSKKRSPWQRTYKDGRQAEWETNPDYCSRDVVTQLPMEQLLDLIDGAIFDFLIQNGDRHHYETRSGRLLLMDNGKGFGNPHKDFLDILAPLYQCCIVRSSTYQRLLLFTGGKLTEAIQELSNKDPVHPIITNAHYKAIERRLLLLFSAIDYCQKKKGMLVN